MQHNNQIISYLQANDILAKKLDYAFHGVSDAVSHQIETVGAGLQRALFYTSCFTTEYQTVCQQQRSEDIRFMKAALKLVHHGHVVSTLLSLYFDEIFRHRTASQLAWIKRSLMALNIHIPASHLTQHGFALAVTATIAAGVNASLNMSVLAGRRAGNVFAVAGIYGTIQNAAECADRLHYTLPAYYNALYAAELEMMYFLIAPLFERSGAIRNAWPSDEEITDIITKMIR